MRKITQEDHQHIETVKLFLLRYAVADENTESLRELKCCATDENGFVTTKGYDIRVNTSDQSQGAAGPIIKTETLEIYIRQAEERNANVKSEVIRAINLLEVSRGRTIIEKRFIGNHSWKKICFDMKISDQTAYGDYKKSMLALYILMVNAGMLPA